MPAKNHDELVAILEAAACEPIGLVLQTSDPAKARAALYRARATENNPRYSALQIRLWPYEEGNLVICHGEGPKPNAFGSIDLGGILELDIE